MGQRTDKSKEIALLTKDDEDPTAKMDIVRTKRRQDSIWLYFITFVAGFFACKIELIL